MSLKSALLFGSFFVVNNTCAVMVQPTEEVDKLEKQAIRTVGNINGLSDVDIDKVSAQLAKILTNPNFAKLRTTHATAPGNANEVLQQLRNLVTADTELLQLKRVCYELANYGKKLDENIKQMEKDSEKGTSKQKDPEKEAFFAKIKLFSSQLKEFTVDAAQIALDLAKIGGCAVVLIFTCRVANVVWACIPFRTLILGV